LIRGTAESFLCGPRARCWPSGGDCASAETAAGSGFKLSDDAITFCLNWLIVAIAGTYLLDILNIIEPKNRSPK